MSMGLRGLALILILLLTARDGLSQGRSNPQPRTGNQAGRQAQRAPESTGVPQAGSNTTSTTQASRSQTAGATAPTRPITPPGSESDKGEGGSSLWATFGWLGVILVGFIVGVRLWKKSQQRGDNRLVSGMIEVLGQHPLDSKHMIRLVRVGQRILVLGCSSEGIQTLSEVTEPDEIALLLGHGGVAQSGPSPSRAAQGNFSQSEPAESAPEAGTFSQLLQHYRSAGGDSSRDSGRSSVGARAQTAHGVSGGSTGGELHRHA